VLKQSAEQAPVLPHRRRSGRRLDLAEDLRLAEDHGVQAAGDLEQVRTASRSLVDIEVRREQLALDAVEAAEPVAQGLASQASAAQ
jgi:hypothetical protein